jgi:hypothetical protein
MRIFESCGCERTIKSSATRIFRVGSVLEESSVLGDAYQRTAEFGYISNRSSGAYSGDYTQLLSRQHGRIAGADASLTRLPASSYVRNAAADDSRAGYADIGGVAFCASTDREVIARSSSVAILKFRKHDNLREF